VKRSYAKSVKIKGGIMKKLVSIIVLLIVIMVSVAVPVAFAGSPTVIRGDNQDQGAQDQQNTVDASQCKSECSHDMAICKANNPDKWNQCYAEYRECLALCKVPDPQ